MQTRLDIGSMVDFLTKGELDDSLKSYREHADAAEQAMLKGIKYIRLPRLTGTVNSGTIGNPAGIGGLPFGPESGYAWSIKRLSVTGLSGANGTGTLPDLVGIARNNTGNIELILSASNPTAHFGKLDFVLFGGDTLYLVNVPNQTGGNTTGTITATGNLTMHGEAISVPQEMLGKLA